MCLFILNVKYSVCLRIHFLRVVFFFYFQVSRDRHRNSGNNSIANISDCYMLSFYYVIAMSVL